MITPSATLAWHSFSKSCAPVVPLLVIWNWWELHWLVPFLPFHNSVFEFLGRFFLWTQSPRGSLLVGVGVRNRYSVPTICIPPLLWWWPLSSVIYELGEIWSWNFPMSWARKIFFCAPKCLHWTWLFMPKGWSLFTPSLLFQSSHLLIVKNPSPFLVDPLLEI